MTDWIIYSPGVPADTKSKDIRRQPEGNSGDSQHHPEEIPWPASPQDKAAISGLGCCGDPALPLPSVPFQTVSQPLHLPNPDHSTSENSGDPKGGGEDRELQKRPEERGAEAEGLKASGKLETRRGGAWVWGRQGSRLGQTASTLP